MHSKYITFIHKYAREIYVINENVLISKRFSQFPSILFAVTIRKNRQTFLFRTFLDFSLLFFNNSSNHSFSVVWLTKDINRKEYHQNIYLYFCESVHSLGIIYYMKEINCQPTERCILCDILDKKY